MRVLKISAYTKQMARQINPSIQVDYDTDYYPSPFIRPYIMEIPGPKIYLDNKNWDEKSALETIDKFVKSIFDMQKMVIQKSI